MRKLTLLGLTALLMLGGCSGGGGGGGGSSADTSSSAVKSSQVQPEDAGVDTIIEPMMLSFGALESFGDGGSGSELPPLEETKGTSSFPIPEPGTAFLLTLGLLGFTGFAYKKFKKVR